MFSCQLFLWSPLRKVWIPMYALFQVKISPWALENIFKVVSVLNYFALHLKQLESFNQNMLCAKPGGNCPWIFFNCNICTCSILVFCYNIPLEKLLQHTEIPFTQEWFGHFFYNCSCCLAKQIFLLNFYLTKGCFVLNTNWHSDSEEEVTMRKVYRQEDNKMDSTGQKVGRKTQMS